MSRGDRPRGRGRGPRGPPGERGRGARGVDAGRACTAHGRDGRPDGARHPATLGTVTASPVLPRLAGALRRLAPSLGPVRLVAVDGHAGSGKSTFAGRLAAALGGAPVLALDDLATHEEFFAWTGRMREQVIEPLGRGEPARYRPYDWRARRLGPARELPPAPVMIVEGVGAGRAALRPWLSCLLWMETPREESWRRGRRRDGPALDAFWDGWTAAERRHFAADPSRPFAHLLVQQCDEGRPAGAVAAVGHDVRGAAAGSPVPAQSRGPTRPLAPVPPVAYAVLPGPAGGLSGAADRAGTAHSLTQRENYQPVNQTGGKRLP
ncbi:hypothetical protein GCM10018793_20530 [Streptomyces sulfonofaciens]|uniref:Uridine kinase n=1 Tax=Streptomyces sulfonofaciens TaxID=68272 RepID=A0A919G0W1_9ACTN|nr:hypothetical protein GCM10018793_20530 [Streptomyces sulfonofaciens]